ncbi:hypothetical protein NEOKW01_1475 [Nematocida sp. AWRm80]|nr:hypothetical protein NEOKW01_1475 [Nematocida sp. AWRm80]
MYLDEYTKLLVTITEILEEKVQRVTDIDKYIRINSILTRLEILTERLNAEQEEISAVSQEHAYARYRKPSEHITTIKTLIMYILTFPDHASVPYLLSTIRSPYK